jgi:O-antigen/teichoic acid export membrane protein
LGVLNYSGWQVPAYFFGGLLLALTSGLMQIGQQWNLRFDELGVLQGGRIVIASIFLLIMLGAAGFDWRNANALVAASALSMFVGAGFSYFRSHNKRRDIAGADGLPGIWRDEFRSAMVITFSGLINRINLSLPVMICAMMGDIVLNGEVALAQRVVNVPIAILAYTAGTMYLSTLLRVLHEDPAGLRGEYMKSAKRLVVMSGAILVPVILCSPLISQLFLGSTSNTMALAIILLSVLGILQSAQGNLSPMLNYLGQEKMQLRYEISMGACCGLIAGFGSYYHVASIWIFIAIIIAQCLGYCFHFRLTLAAIK